MVGVAKAFWSFLRHGDDPLISDSDLIVISQRVHSVRQPDDIANFSSKVLRGMVWMKAAEWQSWTLNYSLYALHGIIPQRLWWLFVRGCSLLYQSCLTIEDVGSAEEFFLLFFETYSKQVEWTHINPSFHFMLHLPACVRKFGSVYNFHCYRFESLNGSPTNNKSAEQQILKRWYSRVHLGDSFFSHMDNRSNEKISLSPELLSELKLSRRFSRRYSGPSGKLASYSRVWHCRVRTFCLFSLLTYFAI